MEKEEVDEICLNTEKEIREYIQSNYPEDYDEFFTSKNQNYSPSEQTQPEDSEELSEEHEIKTKKKNNDAKKLYRKIAEKTHPDKVGGDNYAELFSKASLAYKEQDIAQLLDIAGTLNIELLELSPETIQLLENNVVSLSDQISNSKMTTAWAFHLAKSEEEKKAVAQSIINHLRSRKQ